MNNEVERYHRRYIVDAQCKSALTRGTQKKLSIWILKCFYDPFRNMSHDKSLYIKCNYTAFPDKESLAPNRTNTGRRWEHCNRVFP